MSPMRIGDSRRSEEFARLLDGSAGTAGAAASPTMTAMTGLAGALRAAGSASPLGPDPQFRAQLRQRLVAVATVQAAEPAVSGIGVPGKAGTTVIGVRARRGIAALVGAAAVATSVTGVAVAASRSLPGDPFYGVKKSTEAVQLWAARGDTAKGKRHLEFARTRLAEAQALSPTSSHITSTLSAMNSQTVQGSKELVAAAQSSHSTAPLAALATFSQQQYAGLNQLASTLPPSLRAPEIAAVNVLTTVVKQVQNVAHGRCVLCAITNSPSPLTSTSPAPAAGSPSPGRTHQGVGTKRSGHPHATKTAVTSRGSTAAHSIPTSKTGIGTTPVPLPTKTKLLPLPTLTLPPNPVTSILNPPHTGKTPKPLLSPIPGLTSLLGGIGL